MLTTQSAHRKDITTGKARMEHRHFATMAAIFREQFGAMPPSALLEMAERFADGLADTNPNFDRERFIHACQGM